MRGHSGSLEPVSGRAANPLCLSLLWIPTDTLMGQERAGNKEVLFGSKSLFVYFQKFSRNLGVLGRRARQGQLWCGRAGSRSSGPHPALRPTHADAQFHIFLTFEFSVSFTLKRGFHHSNNEGLKTTGLNSLMLQLWKPRFREGKGLVQSQREPVAGWAGFQIPVSWSPGQSSLL